MDSAARAAVSACGMHLEQREVAEHQPDPALRGRHQLAQDRRGTGAVGALVVAVLDDGDRCAPAPRGRVAPPAARRRCCPRCDRSRGHLDQARAVHATGSGARAASPPDLAPAVRRRCRRRGDGGRTGSIGRRVTMGESADQGRNGGAVRTDPTFYRSAAEAVAAPTEKLAYVVAFDRAGRAARRADRRRRRRGLGRLRRRSSAGRTCRPAATSCTTSAGTPARSALMHAGHDMGPTACSGASCCCPACAARNVHVYDTQPDPRAPAAAQDDRGGGAGRQGRLLPPAHAALRPGRGLPDLPRRRRRRRRARAASRCSTTPRSTCCAPGRPTAGRSTWPTTPGGTSTRTR